MGQLCVTNACGSAVTITVASVNNIPLLNASISVAAGETQIIGEVQSSATDFNDFQFNLNTKNIADQLTSYQINLNRGHWFGDNNAVSPAAYPGSEIDTSLIIKGFAGSNIILGMSYNVTDQRPYYASSDSKGMNPA